MIFWDMFFVKISWAKANLGLFEICFGKILEIFGKEVKNFFVDQHRSRRISWMSKKF